MRAFILFLLAATTAWAQRLHFGVRAGVPVTALLSAAAPGYQAATHRYTLGPTLEARLPHRLAVEVDLLYKSLEYGFAGPFSGGSTVSSSGGETARASRFELPLLIKCHFTRRRLAPFLGGGVCFNWVRGVRDSGRQLAELRHRSTMGFTLGAGVERRMRVLRVSPEIRFTHWVDRNFGVRDAPLRSNLTQAEFLISLTF
jgi:opacity protein-like surface antigen